MPAPMPGDAEPWPFLVDCCSCWAPLFFFFFLFAADCGFLDEKGEMRRFEKGALLDPSARYACRCPGDRPSISPI